MVSRKVVPAVSSNNLDEARKLKSLKMQENEATKGRGHQSYKGQQTDENEYQFHVFCPLPLESLNEEP